MKRTLASLLAGSMALALTGGAALAHGPDASEIALFQKAGHDIRSAIAAAEGATGGKAVKAEFDEHDGTGRWEVKTVAGTKRAEVKVDATTGQVVETKDKGDTSQKDDAVTPDLLGGSLADMVGKAEAAGGGKVMSIDPEHKNGALVGMEVEVVKPDGTVTKSLMNMRDGTLTPIVAGQDHDGDDD